MAQIIDNETHKDISYESALEISRMIRTSVNAFSFIYSTIKAKDYNKNDLIQTAEDSIHTLIHECNKLLANTGVEAIADLPKQNNENSASFPASILSDINILIIDDNKVNRAVLSSLLGDSGAQYETADSGKKAIELCENKKFNVALLDLAMPEMDGYETAKRLKENPINNDLIIIAVSADSGDLVQKKIHEAKIDSFIPKPVNPEVLLQTITMLVNKQNTENGEHILDIDQALKYSGGNKNALTEIFKIFLEDTKDFAYDSSELIKVLDLEALHLRSHTIKGNAGTLGARALYRAARSMDDYILALSNKEAEALVFSDAEKKDISARLTAFKADVVAEFDRLRAEIIKYSSNAITNEQDLKEEEEAAPFDKEQDSEKLLYGLFDLVDSGDVQSEIVYERHLEKLQKYLTPEINLKLGKALRMYDFTQARFILEKIFKQEGLELHA